MTTTAEERRREAWLRATELETFTTHELMDATGRGLDWCRKVIRTWRDQGLVVEQERDKRGQVRWRCTGEDTDAASAYSKERQTPEFAMWRTMRSLRNFTPEDVHMQANTEERPISYKQVCQYCNVLTEAGIIRCVRKRRFGKASARYAIIGRPGPFPPRMLRVPAIYDPNSGGYRVLERMVRP